MDDFFWSYWYYNIPNYLLAAVMYTLLARFLMQFFVPPNWPNYIWRWFLRLTDWAVAVTRAATPSYIGPTLLPLFGALWIFFLRLGATLVLASQGLAPKLF